MSQDVLVCPYAHDSHALPLGIHLDQLALGLEPGWRRALTYEEDQRLSRGSLTVLAADKADDKELRLQ